MNPRSKLALVWTATIVLLGLIVRKAPLHLPQFASKYGGSLLWGAMVYGIFVAILPKLPPLRVGVVAGLFALVVELFKLIHNSTLDAFRQTLAGQLLIGKYFSLWDILAYWIAIGTFAGLDHVRQKRQS